MDVRQKLKEVLISELNLQDISADQIADDEVLFGEKLGLDSLDAVELAVIVRRFFGVEIRDMEQGREAFASISSLTKFIEENRSD